MMKKVVVKLDINSVRQKQKAMKAVSSLKGIETVTIDLKDKRLIVVGDIDPVDLVNKLKNSWHPEIVNVGPARGGIGGEYKSDKNDINRIGMDYNAQIVKLPNDTFYYPSYNPQYYPVYNSMDDTRGCTIM